MHCNVIDRVTPGQVGAGTEDLGGAPGLNPGAAPVRAYQAYGLKKLTFKMLVKKFDTFWVEGK